MDWNGSPPFGRRDGLITTLNLLETKRQPGKVQTIVEIGTTERFLPDALGVAILAFGWYAVKAGNTRIISIDIRQGAVDHSGEIVQQYLPEALPLISYHCGDAYDLLPSVIKQPVDLCYMDMNFEIYDDPEYQGYAMRNDVPSNYIQLFDRFPGWNSGALVLIDDTQPYPPYPVKGRKLVPYMLHRQWNQVPFKTGYPQILLEKE